MTAENERASAIYELYQQPLIILNTFILIRPAHTGKVPNGELIYYGDINWLCHVGSEANMFIALLLSML
jgi:hypothetical protein